MRDRKVFKKLGSGLSLALAVVLIIALFPRIPASADAGASSGGGSSTYDAQYVSERISNNYTKVSAGYTASPYSGADVVISAADAATGETDAKTTSDTRDYAGASQVLDVTAGNIVELTVNVPQKAQYAIAFDYLSYDNSILPIEFSMEVDGAYPYYEARNVKLQSTWLPKAEKSYDRYGDEVVTVPDKAIQWEHANFQDSSYRRTAALLVELDAGEHTFRFQVKSGNFLMGSMSLTAPEQIPEYSPSQATSGGNIITLEAENYTYTNDSSIHPKADVASGVEPYSVEDSVLNIIDADSFEEAGKTVTYEFDVPQEGDYYIAMNYKQSGKNSFPVFMDIRVDGKIPNTAFESYSVAYNTKYQIKSLTDKDGNKLTVHLTAGKHTLSYQITLTPICYVLEALEEIMAGVNDLALEITKVAGTNSDKYRDLKLSRYIPGLEDTLNGYAQQLEDLEASAVPLTDGKKSVAVMASMLIAAEQLRSLADSPDEIPYRIGELASSTNSVNQYLANTIDSLLENATAIDRIWVYEDGATLPKLPGFFQSIGMSIQRFIASFTDQSYSASNIDPSHLQIWVNRSSQYVQLMQKMIDESFTPRTGIQVDISIMPDQYKLVLANSSGTAPDVATGINYTIPYELAVRGALVDMAQFPDFQQTAAPYEPGFFLTGTIGNSVYSMPETMNFWVLVYRTDVLEKLGLEVPNTMEDVVDMLPELQMRGLNFYYPTAGMTAMRNFHGTTPLLFQHGGSLYSGVAQDGTTFGSEASVEGFTTLTDLFTVYDMPVDISNFYQHFRNGDIPIGICDYGTYNLISNAAPELAGSWNIAIVPGTEQADGSIDRSTCGCAESTVIFKSDSTREAQAWEFVKWWSSAEIQAQFGQTMQITYGDEYLWTTANTEAFAQLPLDSDHKEVILQFMKNVVDVARVPGTYMLEREMSNAFNSIVVDGESAQTRIDSAVKVIDREMKRKLEEFGYTDSDGNTITPYVIPNIESMSKILGRN